MGRFHRETSSVQKFHQSDLYQKLKKLTADDAKLTLQFQKDLSTFLVFLANVFDAYKTFAERIDTGEYDSSVADDADADFLSINSLIGTVLQFNHSQSFPLYDSNAKMLDHAVDYSLRYWHQADMIETLYRQFYQELFNHSPNSSDDILNVAKTQKITEKNAD